MIGHHYINILDAYQDSNTTEAPQTRLVCGHLDLAATVGYIHGIRPYKHVAHACLCMHRHLLSLLHTLHFEQLVHAQLYVIKFSICLCEAV